MLDIAFLVGKESDVCKYTRRQRKIPKWLKEGSGDFMEFVNDDGSIPSDVGIAMYILTHYDNCMITLYKPYNKDKITKKDLDQHDVVFVIYDPIEVFHCFLPGRKTCPKDRVQFEKVLKSTKAFVCPPPAFHKYIIDKPRYYTTLKNAGLPVAPFFQQKAPSITTLKDATSFLDKIKKKNWKGAIVKPSYAGYSIGLKPFRSIHRTQPKTVLKYMKKLAKEGFQNLTVQEFIPSFSKHYEIRTYWILGKYAFSVGTLVGSVGSGQNDGSLPVDDEDTFESEGGSLDDKLLKKLKVIAKQVLRALDYFPYTQPMLRIDFGCCLRSDSCDDTFFINEVETMAANLLASETDYPVVEEMGKACYQFAKKVKGKKNRAPRKRKLSKKAIAKNKRFCVYNDTAYYEK